MSDGCDYCDQCGGFLPLWCTCYGSWCGVCCTYSAGRCGCGNEPPPQADEPIVVGEPQPKRFWRVGSDLPERKRILGLLTQTGQAVCEITSRGVLEFVDGSLTTRFFEPRAATDINDTLYGQVIRHLASLGLLDPASEGVDHAGPYTGRLESHGGGYAIANMGHRCPTVAFFDKPSRRIAGKFLVFEDGSALCRECGRNGDDHHLGVECPGYYE